MTTGPVGEAGGKATCKPNYSDAGRKRRKQIAVISALGALAALAFFIATGTAWYTRLLLFFPGSVAAATYLQIKRNTCVSRARAGSIEHDDFSTTPANAEDAAASRRVAATIKRDAALFGLGLALLAAAIAFLP